MLSLNSVILIFKLCFRYIFIEFFPEAIKRYRQIEGLDDSRKSLPIICSSANSGEDIETLAKEAGTDIDICTHSYMHIYLYV